MLILSVSSGLGFYNMSVYMVELSGSLGFPLAELSIAVSLFFVSGGVGGIYLARYVDHFDLKIMMSAGVLVCGLALWSCGYATELWQLYLAFSVYGLGGTAVSLVIATTLVTRWFPGKDRSIALSVAFTGLSLGGITFTPLSAYLFNATSVAEGFTYIALLFVIVSLPLILFFMRMPEGVAHAATSSVDVSAQYRQAVRTRFFILVSIGFILTQMAQVGGIAHLYGRVNDLTDFASAAIAVQVLSGGSIVGRLIGGVIATRVVTWIFALVMLTGQFTGLVLIGLADSFSTAILGAAIFGLSVGNLLMSQPLWLAEIYAPDIYPRVYALSNALTVIGVAAGPFLLGVFADASGYAAAYFFSALVCAVAGVMLYVAARVGKGTNATT